MLERYLTPGCAVLDTGCGSGILSIAALLLGAGKAVGVDIDELAVKTAKENGKLNGFTEPQYTVLQGNLADKVTGLYDVVVANIVADVIIGLAPAVRGLLAEGGVFLCSGIIDVRAPEVAQRLRESGLEITETRSDDGWFAYLCR